MPTRKISQYDNMGDPLGAQNDDPNAVEQEEAHEYVEIRLGTDPDLKKTTAQIRSEVSKLASSTYGPAPVRNAQQGANQAAGVGSQDGNGIEMHEPGKRSAAALDRNDEGDRNNNTRRYCALLGITGVTAASTIIMGIFYALLNAKTNGQPPPDMVTDATKKTVYDQIDAWEKATASDADFWEFFAKLVTDPAIQPPLTLVDNIPFCSYVMDHNPIKEGGFLFLTADDPTLFVMQLVAAYAAQMDAGKTFGEGAAAMYRLVPTLKYSSDGGSAKPFPRQVQSLLLRGAFVALTYPTPAAEMMSLAAKWAALADAEYWKKFTDYLADTKLKPPLTVNDQIEFCNYTAAVSPTTDFMFPRPETESTFIKQLVAKLDPTTKSTAGLYTFVSTLAIIPGTPLPRRVQAHLLNAALSQIEIASGSSLFDLVGQWAAKSDADYWAAFVAYQETTKPPLVTLDEIHFCSYTVEQFPVPHDYVPIDADTRTQYVTRLMNQYTTDGSTIGVYPLLARLADRPPQLPRAVQAQVMRLFLVQIGL